MNQEALRAHSALMITISQFFTLGGSGYPPNHPHGARQPATLEGALALVAAAGWILSERLKRGLHYHSALDVIIAQRAELLEALDAVEARPATAAAAGRRSA